MRTWLGSPTFGDGFRHRIRQCVQPRQFSLALGDSCAYRVFERRTLIGHTLIPLLPLLEKVYQDETTSGADIGTTRCGFCMPGAPSPPRERLGARSRKRLHRVLGM